MAQTSLAPMPRGDEAAPHPVTSMPWIIELLCDRTQLIVAFAIAALIASVAIAFLIPVRYEATARLMPPDQSGSTAALMGALMGQAGALGGLASDALGIRTQGATVVGILQSRSVQDDLINRFDLRKQYGKKLYDDARKVLQNRTSVSEDKKSGIITISVQDHNPQRAAAMGRGYIEALNARVAQLTTSSAHRERVFLEERIGTIKADLDEATLQLSRFSSKNKTLDPQVQGKAMLEAASALQGQLIAAETELSGLRQIYGPENARVKAASAKAGELRNKLRTMSGGQVSEEGGANEELYPSLEQLPLLGNTYYELARRAKIEEALYEVLIKQYELAKVQEAKELPSIKVLDEPAVPERKAYPPRMLLISLGLILGLCCGVAWAFMLQLWQKLPETDPVKIGFRDLAASLRSRGVSGDT